MAKRNSVKELYDVPEEPVSEGVIMEGVLSHYVSPKTAISYAENLHNDTVGMMTSRRPFVNYKVFDAGVGQDIKLISCTQTADSIGRPYIIFQVGSTIESFELPSFTGSVAFSATKLDPVFKTRYDVFGTQTLMTPPQAAGQLTYLSGTAATVTAVAGTSFPAGMNLISAGFDQRIWMANTDDYLCYVYYTNPISGAASTATGGSGYVKIQSENNDNITGLIKTQRCLYVFTQHNIFQVFNTSSLDNAPVAFVGALCQEGIVKSKNGYYFYNPTGVFFLQAGGQPQEVSVKVRDIIRKVNPAYQHKVFGWSESDSVTFCLGNNLIGYQPDKTYYIRYTISTQVWTIYSTLGFLPTCASSRGTNYIDNHAGGAVYTPTKTENPIVVLFGNPVDNTGATIVRYAYGGTFNVFTPTTENSDVAQDWILTSSSIAGYAIPLEYQTNWLTFDIENHDKRANGLYVPSVNGAGLKVAYQTDQDLPNVWREIGVLSSNYITAFNSWQSNEFNRIKFRIYGNNTSGAIVQIGVPRIKVLDDLGFKTN